MLRHIVMWNFHDHALGADRLANVAQAQTLLLSCASVVPGIRVFEVATAAAGLECAADLVLHMLVDDAQVLAQYQQHPHHVAIKPFMNAVVRERRCMDFIVEPQETDHGTHFSATL